MVLFHNHHHRRVQRLNGDRGFDGGRQHGLHLSLGNVWVGELHHLLFPPPRADRGILRDFVAHRRFLFAAALLFFVTKHAGTDGAAAAQHEDDDDDDDDPYWRHTPTATATKVQFHAIDATGFATVPKPTGGALFQVQDFVVAGGTLPPVVAGADGAGTAFPPLRAVVPVLVFRAIGLAAIVPDAVGVAGTRVEGRAGADGGARVGATGRALGPVVPALAPGVRATHADATNGVDVVVSGAGVVAAGVFGRDAFDGKVLPGRIGSKANLADGL